MKNIRVLWFSNTSSNYNSNSNVYNGGGWISSLEKEIKDLSLLKLGVSFFAQGESFKVEQNGVTYYPLSIDRSLKSRIKRFNNIQEQEAAQIAEMLKVIADFKPDVIHVFGSERIFGLISYFTAIPVIIHLQGLINPYLNAYFPPSYSVLDLFAKKLAAIRNIIDYRGFKIVAKREEKILRNCKFFMGRTDWDHRIAKLYSPGSKYFYCSEILREDFYLSDPWKCQDYGDGFRISSTISSPFYKGADLLLKTAQILKDQTNIKFRWNVFGVDDLKCAERKTGIAARDVFVRPKGVVSSLELSSELGRSNCYFHSSYIDNSPNSICEAQLLGLPVISTNVGGISSLIKNKISGMLLPANDPFIGASFIEQLSKNQKLSLELGASAREIALKRHNKKSIIKDISKAYASIRK